MTFAAPAVINETFITLHRPYDTNRFVNRDFELSFVREQIRLVQEQGFSSEPVINYWGVRGIGKTWVLSHLLHTYKFRLQTSYFRPTCAVLYSAENSRANQLSALVAHLSQELLAQLGSALDLDEQSLIERSLNSGELVDLATAISAFAKRFLPIVMVDDCECFDAEQWKAFVGGFIEPLVPSGRVLIILAGRRQAPRWSRFEVRNKVAPPERTLIRAFNKEAVINQIGHADYTVSREIVDLMYPYTAGNPQIVDAIARHVIEWTPRGEDFSALKAWFDQRRTALAQILQKALDQLLEHTPQHLLPYLQAVAPLRFYHLAAMRNMLAGQEDGGRYADGYYHQILRDLDINTEVVWWERERRAYVTSDVVRQIMSRHQLLADPKGYVERHTIAVQMYRRWVTTFPQASEEFIVEIIFHQACLYLEHRDIAHLQEQTTKHLSFANDHLNLERFHTLQRQLEGDREIFDLCPPQVRQQLIQDLASKIAAKAES